MQQAPAVEVHQLARALLVANTRWHVALHDTLSWLAEGDWPALVAAALQSAPVRGSMSEAERTVLEAASYQQPGLLAPLQSQLEELDWGIECFEPETQVQNAQSAMHLIFPPHYLRRGISWIPRHWLRAGTCSPALSAGASAVRVWAAASIVAGLCSI